MVAWLGLNLCGALAAIAAWSASRRSRRGAYVAAGILLAALVFRSILAWRPAWEGTLFPWPWYIYLQGFWTFLLGAAFMGLAIPLLRTRRLQLLVALLVLALLVRGGHATWWMVSFRAPGFPIYPDARHHLMQGTGFTCAPCACAMALGYLGIRASEREMAGLCLTRQEGTTQFNTFRGLALRLEGTPWRARIRDLPAAALLRPGLVAVVDRPDLAHAFTVRGEGDHLLVHDPLRSGPQPWTLAEFARVYGGTAVVLEPRD